MRHIIQTTNKKTMKPLNKRTARRILEVVDRGLIKGLGSPEPGNMCIEAAVNYALGAEHGDKPKCVGKNVRKFKIALNDSFWPTDKDRTKGMRKLAIAQLGSDTIDQDEFLEKVGYRCMTTVLPEIVEGALKEDKDNEFVKQNVDVKELKRAVKELKSAKDFDSAKATTKRIRDIYSASASVYAYVSAYVSAYASASASASASDYAYVSAYVYMEKNPQFARKILNLIAKAGLDTLIEMKSPGVKWLDICE